MENLYTNTVAAVIPTFGADRFVAGQSKAGILSTFTKVNRVFSSPFQSAPTESRETTVAFILGNFLKKPSLA